MDLEQYSWRLPGADTFQMTSSEKQKQNMHWVERKQRRVYDVNTQKDQMQTKISCLVKKTMF